VPSNDELNACARDWIARMAVGDEAAVAALYDATLGHVYGLAVRITQDPDAAEDVVAETYLQAWQQAGRYSAERGAPLAWLLNMCRSRALDHLRRRGPSASAVAIDTEMASMLSTDADDDPLSLGNCITDGERVREAIAGLPDVVQKLVGLAFFSRLIASGNRACDGHALRHGKIAFAAGAGSIAR
jgi:RNA polymerase sigma-70 factor (ECF subfamily)